MAVVVDQQRQAVLVDPKASLQILASPGTGKTKTLTSRVAHLVLHHGIEPKHIVVVTFANKAANEMKVRLRKMIGESQVSQLRIGTFHALCVRYLRRHGALLDIQSNFVICDQTDALSIIKNILKKIVIQAQFTDDHLEPPKPGSVQDRISKAKAKGWTPDQLEHHCNERHDIMGRIISEIYRDYQIELDRQKAMDFDDLLIHGHRLFKKFPSVYANIVAVLVDEWQDTNMTQYEIAKCLASKCRALTVVGDPDQSIYGWRSAEVENLNRMISDFRPVIQMFLEENYRSTGAILAASSAVIDQDPRRIQKTLRTSRSSGQRVVLKQLDSAASEASYVASEIKRLLAQSGNSLQYSDFAILLRYNALSRPLEQALQSAGIPNRVMGGSKFFDRVEIKDILAYLQLVENPDYGPAFERVINVPKRAIGAQTLTSILDAAQRHNCPPMEIVTRAIRGKDIGGIKPAQKKALKPFVAAIGQLKKRADAGESVPDLIRACVDLVEYEPHLTRTYGIDDATSRMQNLEELKAFAVQIAEQNGELLALDEVAQTDDDQDTSQVVPEPMKEEPNVSPSPGDLFDEAMEVLESSQRSAATEVEQNPLRIFLAACMLSTDTAGDNGTEDDKRNRVTISTVHSAKGSEWPVVFVCAVEAGIYPFYRADTQELIDEERRLLFVAMTRAQVTLEVTYAGFRMRGTYNAEQQMSVFLSPIASPTLGFFSGQADQLTDELRTLMWSVLGRPAVAAEELAAILLAYQKSLGPTQAYQAAGGIQIRTEPYSSQPQTSMGYRNYSSVPTQARNYNGYTPSSQTRPYASSQPLPSTSQSYPSQGFRPASHGFQAASQGFRPSSQGFQPASQAMKPQLLAAETRMSRIPNGALINPTAPLSAPAPPPSLSSFQSASNAALDILKNLGPAESAGASSLPVVNSTSNKRKAAPGQAQSKPAAKKGKMK